MTILMFTYAKGSGILWSILACKRWDFLAPSLKYYLYFRKELTGPENQARNIPW